MTHHPHVHLYRCQAAASRSTASVRWLAGPAASFLPLRLPLRLFHDVPGEALAAHQRRPPKFFGDHSSQPTRRTRSRRIFAHHCRRPNGWFYAKRPFGVPQSVADLHRANTPTASPSPKPANRLRNSSQRRLPMKDYVAEGRDRRRSHDNSPIQGIGRFSSTASLPYPPRPLPTVHSPIKITPLGLLCQQHARRQSLPERATCSTCLGTIGKPCG